MSNHTPTPWRSEYDDNGFYHIQAEGRPSPYIVATGGEGDADKANAEFIVRACNSHYELLAFIESLTDTAGPYPFLDGTRVVSDAYCLLAKTRRAP